MSFTVEELVAKSQSTLQEQFPDKFQQLKKDPAKFQRTMDKLKQHAQEEIMLAKNLAGKAHGASSRELHSEVSNVLSKERVQMIRDGLTYITYKMEIHERSDGTLVTTRRGRTDICPPQMLTNDDDVEYVKKVQYISIALEVVLLDLRMVGIPVGLTDEQIQAMVPTFIQMVENPAVRQALDALVRSAGPQQIFQLTKILYRSGFFWLIVKEICKNMAWYNYVEAVALIALQIVAALATEGVAFIAEAAIALDNAAHFMEKLANMLKFHAM